MASLSFLVHRAQGHLKMDNLLVSLSKFVTQVDMSLCRDEPVHSPGAGETGGRDAGGGGQAGAGVTGGEAGDQGGSWRQGACSQEALGD